MTSEPETNALSIIKGPSAPKHPGAPNWLQKVRPFKAGYEKRLENFRSFTEDRIGAQYAALKDPELRRMALDILLFLGNELRDLDKVPIKKSLSTRWEEGKQIGSYLPKVPGMTEALELKGGVFYSPFMNAISQGVSGMAGKRPGGAMYNVYIDCAGKEPLSLELFHDLAVMSELIAPDAKPNPYNRDKDGRAVFIRYPNRINSRVFYQQDTYLYGEEAEDRSVPGATNLLTSEYIISSENIPALRSGIERLSAAIQRHSQLSAGRA